MEARQFASRNLKFALFAVLALIGGAACLWFALDLFIPSRDTRILSTILAGGYYMLMIAALVLALLVLKNSVQSSLPGTTKNYIAVAISLLVLLAVAAEIVDRFN